MSAICTPEQIAEKKRIAEERLKQKGAKKISNATVTSPGNTKTNNLSNINSNLSNPVIFRKPAATFYNKPPTNFNKPNCNPIKTTNKSIQNEENSYGKFISALPKQISLQQDQKQSSTNSSLLQTPKIFPIFGIKIKCELSIISETQFVVKPSKFHEQLILIFKTIPSKHYDPKTHLWAFNISDYQILQKRAETLKPEVELDEIPKQILELLHQPKEELDISYLPSIESKLVNILMQFQKEGVCLGIRRKGRVMIADEMGLGKTLQALAIADYFKEDWPLLITTTASTRSCWYNHIKDYLPSVRCHNIVTLNSADFNIHHAKIVITSYSLMEKHVDKIMECNFGVLIFDESHNLKSFDAKRTKNAEKLVKNAKRIILLSGTPALSKPVELYSQVKLIDKNFLPFKVFSQRYCEGKQTNFGWDSSGQSNLTELNIILKKKFMIRRLKSEVLSQLSEKNRETINLNPDLIKLSEEAKKNFNELERKLHQGSLGNQSKDLLLMNYARTAEIKSKAVCHYLISLIKDKKKFIVFAHHKVMITAISNFLFERKVDFIRIDGTTKSELREEFIKRFQTRSTCTVALLSLHACNAGITLTAADLVVFAELDWNPSTLAQAESRAHRIGQQNNVTCRYLLAENTADTVIWKMLKEKQDVLNSAGLFSENLQNAEHCLAPTSNEKIEKYFTPTKRKVEDFYKPTTSNDSLDIKEKESIPPKRFKPCDNIENSNKLISGISNKKLEFENNTGALDKNKKAILCRNNQITNSEQSDYDYLFNELDDADIPETQALINSKCTKTNQNHYDTLFNDMEDADFADLKF